MERLNYISHRFRFQYVDNNISNKILCSKNAKASKAKAVAFLYDKLPRTQRQRKVRTRKELHNALTISILAKRGIRRS